MFDRYVELVRTMAAGAGQGGSGAGRLRADERAGRRLRRGRHRPLARAPAAALCRGARLGDAADDRAHRRLLFERRGAGADRPEGDPRRQHHLDVPLLRSVPADASGRDLGRRLHPLRDRACPIRPTRCRAPSSTRRSRRSASASATEAPWARRNGMLAYLDEQIATMDTKEKLDAIIDRPFEIAASWAKAERHRAREHLSRRVRHDPPGIRQSLSSMPAA